MTEFNLTQHQKDKMEEIAQWLNNNYYEEAETEVNHWGGYRDEDGVVHVMIEAPKPFPGVGPTQDLTVQPVGKVNFEICPITINEVYASLTGLLFLNGVHQGVPYTIKVRTEDAGGHFVNHAEKKVEEHGGDAQALKEFVEERIANTGLDVDEALEWRKEDEREEE